MKKTLFLAFMALLLLGCNSFSEKGINDGTDWALFRGDASLSGYSTSKLPDNLGLLWTYKSNERTSSSPIMYNNTAYWCSKRGKIYGIDQTGNQSFEYDFATAVEATPTIYDSTLYIGRIDGFVSAVSLTSKDPLWNYETMGQVSASPNICNFEGGKAIVVGSYDNYLYCLNQENGMEINKYISGYYINGAVAIWDDYFVSGGCDAWLRVVNGVTGEITDSLKLDTYIPASPAIWKGHCYIADHFGNVYDIELKDGKIANWKKMVEAQDSNSTFVSVPAVCEDMLYIVSDDQHVYAINRQECSVQWKYLLKGATGESSPVICTDKLVACTRSGVVSILNRKNGELLWEYDTGEQITGSPAVINGYLYVLTAKGTLFCFGSKQD